MFRFRERSFFVKNRLHSAIPILFFPMMFLYEEFLLRAFATEAALLDYHFWFLLAVSISCGLMTWLLISLIRPRTGRLAATVIVTLVTIVVFCVEYCCKSFYKTFFEVAYMLQMSGNVVNDFAAEAISVVISSIPYILAAMIPLVLLILLRNHIVQEQRSPWMNRALMLIGCAILDCCLLFVLLFAGGNVREDFTYASSGYTANTSIPRFGVVQTLRLEIIYSVTGTPEEALDSDIAKDLDIELDLPEPFATPTVSVEVSPEPVVYDYNVLDIDFEGLLAETSDETLRSMHTYFSALTPTQQNEYTGMFEGKNLILLCCEAFSHYIIDEELTPTLYQLYNEGFQFTNFYQPDWGQSTTGGEFAVMTGIAPTKINGKVAFLSSLGNSMPYALGNQFGKLGYTTLAYHNGTYNYYSRDKTHPNLGYTFQGIGNGLKLKSTNIWPYSDLEMMESTVDGYINDYVQTGTPFHTYYMTISGHANYHLDGNAMSHKHKSEVLDLPYSSLVQGYIACSLELEAALTYLMDKLEAAGIADETVIALTADHYPYALTEKQSKDYYNELEPVATTIYQPERYRNGFLLWCGSMTEPVIVDTPCSSIDIVPTLSNLFGLEYDSRLFTGRDILSTNYEISNPSSPQPFVIFPDTGSGYSWISVAGEYNAYSKTFTPAAGYEAYAESDAYISAMTQKAKNMFAYAKQILAKDYYSVVLGE